MRTLPARSFFLLAAVACSLMFAAKAYAQYDLSPFLPAGVSVASASPQQITEAIVAAVKADPGAAADIAAGSLQSVYSAGRYTLPGSQDGKQSADPDGSSSDPTLEDWAGRIADAAKQGNPDPLMAPKIDSAVSNKLNSLTPVPGGGDGGGGSSGGGGPPPVAPIPGGGGGGGGTGTPTGSS